jgi:hypothetical protein
MATARRVAMKMARRQRCFSVTYRSSYAPSSRLANGSFLSQRKLGYFADRTLGLDLSNDDPNDIGEVFKKDFIDGSAWIPNPSRKMF